MQGTFASALTIHMAPRSLCKFEACCGTGMLVHRSPAAIQGNLKKNGCVNHLTLCTDPPGAGEVRPLRYRTSNAISDFMSFLYIVNKNECPFKKKTRIWCDMSGCERSISWFLWYWYDMSIRFKSPTHAWKFVFIVLIGKYIRTLLQTKLV
jgi:hypothetical protein